MRTRTGDEIAGLAAMAACAFLWSIAGLVIKLVDWNPLAIAGGRSLIAAVFLLAWVRRPRFTFSGAQLAAALANAATMLLFVYANKTTTSANAILLQYGAPVYVALLGAPLLKEKPRAEHWAALLAIAAGMILLFMEGLGGGSLFGNLAAVASGVTFALYILFMRKQKGGSPIESVILAHGMVALVALAGSFFLPPPTPSWRSLGALAVLGVFQIGLAAVFFSYGIKRVSAVASVLVAVIEPVFNPVWVFLVTGEAPGGKAIAGGLVIVVAVIVSSVVSVRRDSASGGAAGEESA